MSESIVRCQKCGQEIGKIVKILDREFLEINGILVNHMRGVCSRCYTEFYWSFSERILADLLKRLSNNWYN